MFLRGLFLAACLVFATSCNSAEAPKGYDVAVCNPTDYYGAHFKVDGKDLIVDYIIEKPGEVVKAEKILRYKFVSADGDKQLFAYVDNDGDKLELIIDFKVKRGQFLVNRHLGALLFLDEDADGSKLVENAANEVKACVDTLEHVQRNVQTRF